jgi:outer membrane protein with beta-barrel domain
LFRPRSAALAAFALALTVSMPGAVFAAAEVHRFNLALSATPTGVDAGDLNDAIDFYNRTYITPPPRGYEPLDQISFSWLFTGELRYFLTRNLAMSAGLSQLRAKTTKEYLPALSQSINVRADLITVPVHIGAAYYLQPYNQGDFQARMFFGGGLVSYTHSRTSFQQTLAGVDSTTNAQLGGSFKLSNTQDSPGYYTEAGAHMFFASRYSVLLSVLYRSGHISGMVDERTGDLVRDPETGKPFSLDVSGFGFRMAAIIGL